jgi:hypothetical protein
VISCLKMSHKRCSLSPHETLQNILATLCPILYKLPLSPFDPLTESIAKHDGHSICLIKCSNKVRVNSDISNELNNHS